MSIDNSMKKHFESQELVGEYFQPEEYLEKYTEGASIEYINPIFL